MEKVLNGVRVLDFTDALSGPYCTRYMADCGAEVLNIEKPGGKLARGIPYFHKGVSVDFTYNHCGKKSIGIDMKKGSKELALLNINKILRGCIIFILITMNNLFLDAKLKLTAEIIA